MSWRAGLVLSLGALMAACGGGDDAEVNAPVAVEATPGFVVLGASADGVLKVEAPEGSSAVGVAVTVEEVDPGNVSGSGLFDGVDILAAYDLGPDGTQFDEPVVVTSELSLTALGLRGGAFPVLVIGTGDSVDELSEIDHSLVLSGDTIIVTSELDHFSSLVVGFRGGSVEFTIEPNMVTIEVGQSADVTVTATPNGNPAINQLSILTVPITNVAVVASVVSLPFNEPTVLTVTCSNEGLDGVVVRLILGHPAFSIGGFDVTCTAPPPPTTTTQLETTTTTEASVEAAAVELGVPTTSLFPTASGIIVAGFGEASLWNPQDGTTRVLDLPHRVDYESADGECPFEHCFPEFLGFDEIDNCLWISLPDGFLNCWNVNTEPPEAVVTVWPCQDGRSEKSENSCLPSAPGRIDGIDDVTFVNLGDGALFYIDAEGKHRVCADLDRNFDLSAISFEDGQLKIPTKSPAGEIEVFSVNWETTSVVDAPPSCAIDSETESGGPIPEGEPVEFGGTTYAASGTGTQITLSAFGASIEIAFDEEVVVNRPVAVEADGVLFIYLDGPVGGGIYRVVIAEDPRKAERVVSVGQIGSIVIVEGVLYASDVAQNKIWIWSPPD